MKRLKIEFFHDVICSFCFPMSYVMRKIEDELDVEIVHRSFAVMYDEHGFSTAYGSRERAKEEIIGHWKHANEMDELKRFNIEGMRKTDFPFPSSRTPLKVCKAAFYAGGDDLYWDVFDALQEGLFVKNVNIEDEDVIYGIVKDIKGLDFDKWLGYYTDGTAHKGVMDDLELASRYGINSAPTLIIDGKYFLSGAATYESVKNTLLKLEDQED